MTIGYLVNTYPRPSHSFIRREIRAIERAGVPIHRFALRPPTEILVEAADAAEAAKTEYLLAQGVSRLLMSAVGQFLIAPLTGLKALLLAIRLGRHSQAGLARHLIYLFEGAALARRCKSIGIAHLHVHFGTNSATVAMLCGTFGGPSWSLTVHGPEEFDAPADLSLPEKLRRAAFTIGVSAFGRSQLCRWARLEDWQKINVVHCGIETIQPSLVAPLPTSGIRLVSIGRFAEQKGQLLLLEAFAQAASAHPDLHLTLVGDGVLRPEIEASVHARGLAGRVTLAGWLNEAGVQAEINAAHALVMPSFAEGLPVVIMEAMFAGRAVISTYVAGIPELVRHGETGWLLPAGDSAALAQAICALAEAPRHVLEMYGRAGRERVLGRHDVDCEAQKLMTLFRRVIEQKQTQARTSSESLAIAPGDDACPVFIRPKAEAS